MANPRAPYLASKPQLWICLCGKVWSKGRACNVCRLTEAQADELRQKK